LRAVLLGLALFALLPPYSAAEKKAVMLTKEWSGSVEDENLAKDAPEYIAEVKALEKLWKKWKVEGKQPEVDFKKEIVIVTTTVGSKLSLSARLDDKGNLEVIGAATRDIKPGFRYGIATVSRDGVKTVNDKELKEAKEKP
jgi:uncharacterized membrane-anchored protein YjiN (DUF445 family)